MEIACDLLKSISADAVSNGSIVEVSVRRPIVSDLRELVDAHKDHESKVGPDLFHVGRPLLSCTLQDLSRVAVSLLDNQAHQVVVKKSENSPHGSGGRGTVRPACSTHGVTMTGAACVDHAVMYFHNDFTYLFCIEFSY